MIRSRLPVALAALTLGCAHPSTRPAAAPDSGRMLLQRMHDRYAGRWFRTLTFVQKTTRPRPDGTTSEQTWYEAMLAPRRLRIDIGAPADGNGVITTPESTYVVRGGQLQRATGTGNPFVPFVGGLYTQPLDSTLRDLAPYQLDVARGVREDVFAGRPVWVAGASGVADTRSPQIWVDRERLVLVRMILPPEPGQDGGLDVTLGRYVPVGGSWLATHVVIASAGRTVQTEDYRDWRVDVPLPRSFFDAAGWSSTPHWATH